MTEQETRAMKRWERVWIVEYRADSGKWYPCGNEFYDFRHESDAEIRNLQSQEIEECQGTYRSMMYVRRKL